MTGLAVVFDLPDLSLDPCYALGFCIFAEKFRIERGVELEGVVDSGKRRLGAVRQRPHEFALASSLHHQRIGEQVVPLPGKRAVDPVLVEGNGVEIATEIPKRVDVTVAFFQPVDEFDAQFERRVGFAHEGIFVDPQHGIETDDRRDGGFPDTDGPDRFRFDQRHARPGSFQHIAERGRGHPAGGSAANNHDIFEEMRSHIAVVSLVFAAALP